MPQAFVIAIRGCEAINQLRQPYHNAIRRLYKLLKITGYKNYTTMFKSINELMLANMTCGQCLFAKFNIEIITPIIGEGEAAIIGIKSYKMRNNVVVPDTININLYKVHSNGKLTALAPNGYFTTKSDLKEFIKHQYPVIIGSKKSFPAKTILANTLMEQESINN